VASSRGETVKLWRVNGTESISIGNYGTLSMNFSTDGQALIFLNKDGSLKHRLLDGTLLKSNASDCGDVSYAVANLSSNSKITAYSRRDNNIVLENSSNFIGCRGGDELSHQDRVTYLSFSPDDKLIASASRDKTVKLWNIDYFSSSIESDLVNNEINSLLFSPDGISVAVSQNVGQAKIIKPNHYSKLLADSSRVLGFSPNGQFLVTDSSENIIDIWRRNKQPKSFHLPDQHTEIRGVYVSPEGGKFVTVTENNIVKLWNQDGTLIKQIYEKDNPIVKVSFSPDDNLIALIGSDNRVHLLNSDGKHIAALSSQLKQISEVVFSPDSKLLAAIGSDTLISLYRNDGSLVKTLVGHTNSLENVRFTPDSQVLISINSASQNSREAQSSTINLWRSQDGNLIKTIPVYNFRGITLSPDGNVIASLNDDSIPYSRTKTVQLLNIDGTVRAILSGHQDFITSLSFSPDGKRIITGSRDQTIRLWNTDGTLIKVIQKHNATITSLDFSPDGQTFASVSADNMMMLWNVDGNEIKTFQKADEVDDPTNSPFNREQSNAIKFSTDGNLVIFAGERPDQGRIIKMWDNNGKEFKSFTVKESPAVSRYRNTVSSSENLNTIAIIRSKNDLKLWNTEGRLIKTLQGHTGTVNSADFNLANRLLASASDDGTVKMWSADGILLHTLQHNGKVHIVRFRPDGKILASASDDRTIRLWNIDGTLHHTPLRHDDKVNTISFSPDGNLLASASDDKTVRLWDKHGNLIDTLKHNDKIVDVIFSPDSKDFASKSIDGTVKVWSSNNRKEVMTTKVSPYTKRGGLEFSPDSKILATSNNGYGGNTGQLSFPKIWLKDASFTSDFTASDFQFTSNGKAIAVAQGDEVKFLSLDLDTLLVEGCDKVRSYLKTNPNVSEGDRNLCDGIGSQKPEQ
jgi:WD40 repeat protein